MNHRLLARWMFALSCLVFAVSVVGRILGIDPYPALLMPSFANSSVLSGNTLTMGRAEFVAYFPDGSSSRVPADQIVPVTPDIPGPVLERALGPSKTEDTVDPGTKRWLKSRLQEVFPGQDITAVNVVWETMARSTVDGSAKLIRQQSLSIDLRSIQ